MTRAPSAKPSRTTALVLGLVLLGVSLAAAHTLRQRGAEQSADVTPEGARVVAERVAEPPSSNAPDSTGTIAAASAELQPLPEQLNEPLAIAPTAPAPTDIGQPRAPSATAPLPQPGKSAPTSAQIRAAMSAVPIVMFSASWCGVCNRTRAFLRANDCSFVERDIDRDPAAMSLLRGRFGKVAVPVLDIDGQLQQPGFDPDAIIAELALGAERRLGVQGIRAQRTIHDR